MAKDRVYDTERGNVSDDYAKRIKIDPSSLTVSLDEILYQSERLARKEEGNRINSSEDTQ